MKAMRAELTTLKSTKPGGGRGGGGGDKKAAAEARAALLNVWRQWKFWCHSCGCNLNHNSNNCTSFKKKSGHKDEATMQNPMGGNEGKNELHNKWWSPVDHKPYDKPE